MKLSIVTITFNNYVELIKTLDSIKKDKNIEIVVINGGSCQKTQDYLAKNQYINSLTEKDHGISDAFNKGMLRATGEAFCFLNSGDLLLDQNYYLKSLDLLRKDSSIDFIFADILFDHKSFGKLHVKPSTHPGKTPFPHPGLIIRSSIQKNIGDFDINLKVAMDFDFMCRIKKANLKGYYYQDSPVVLMDGLGVSSGDGLVGLREREFSLRKYKMMTWQSLYYFQNLKLKNSVRHLLKKLHLLELYDRFKIKMFKIDSE
jgi:glycosyltransferase involved in cell wall biosynthesis